MSQYIHEIVLQEYIIEKISSFNLNVKYNNTHHKIVEAKTNRYGTFWDLEGKLDNGIWIPIEVEWISENFIAHRHQQCDSYESFLKRKGILIVVRKSRELEKVQQYAILDLVPQNKFKILFSRWLKNKSEEYSLSTLNDFLVGNYKRKLPRILVIPISANARKNYFSMEPLYRKKRHDPLVLGFKENGYINNEFVRDIQPGDICLFIDSDGTRSKRNEFIQKVKNGELVITKLVAFQIKSKLFEVRNSVNKLDKLYWPDEIKVQRLIYPHRCTLSDSPFVKFENTFMPNIESFTEDKWEQLRSCIQYGAYFEMDANDFLALISNIQIKKPSHL